MPKIIYIIILIFIAVVMFLYFPFKLKSRNIKINNQDFSIEIATTPQQLSKGLSNRTSLCQNCGMLFIFPSPQILQFWMKDTRIPLDMIFIDENKKIVNIVTALPAEASAAVGQVNLPIYKSSGSALYCLELNANRSTELNLKIGDQIDL